MKVPTWLTLLMVLAALAGIGTLFTDGLVQVALTAFVGVSIVVYLRNRLIASKSVDR